MRGWRSFRKLHLYLPSHFLNYRVPTIPSIERLVALSVARYPNLMKLMKENRDVIEGLNIPGKDPTHLNVTEIIQMAEHLESDAN